MNPLWTPLKSPFEKWLGSARMGYVSVLSEATRSLMMGGKVSDEASLSIKPLEGSRSWVRRTRSMEIQSIWGRKSLQKRHLREKLWLLMLVNVLLPAFIPEWYAAEVCRLGEVDCMKAVAVKKD